MAREPYDPVNSVAPTGATDTPLQVQATPGAFGGQVGEAEQKLGGATEQAGGQAFDVFKQQQGMINESLATNAETDYMTKLGAITGDYKSKEGLDAVAALPQAKQDIAALREQIAGTLPNPMAQQSFNMLALRHEGFALQDASSYAAGQIKQASLTSSKASVDVAVARAGSSDVAGNDQQFSGTLQDIDFHVRNLMQLQGWGPQMSEDPQTHALTFADTDQGKQAQAAYTNSLQMAQTKAWENRIATLSQGNLPQAVSTFEANKDTMPPEAQFNIGRALQPKIQDMQARGIGDGITGQSVTTRSTDIQNNPNAPAAPGTLVSAILGQESGNKDNAPTSINGAVGPAQITPGTFAQYARPGENISNPTDNRAVGQRIIADLTTKYGYDPARVAVGYFSGPGNVAPLGSPTPWINDTKDGNGKSVSSYVADITKAVSGQPATSIADQYRRDYAQNLQAARDQAEALHPGDAIFAAQAVSRVEQNMNIAIAGQEKMYAADANMVQQAAMTGINGKVPNTVDELRAISPDVAAAWDRMSVQNPLAANHVQSEILTHNSKNDPSGAAAYGPGFWNAYKQVLAPQGDPTRITSPTDILMRAGPGGDLTLAGAEKLSAVLKQTTDDVDGHAQEQMKSGVLEYAKHQLSFEADYGTYKVLDPKGKDAFDIKFLPAFFKYWDDGIKAGKSPQELAQQDKIDALITPYKRSPAQIAQDAMTSDVSLNAGKQVTAPTLPQGLPSGSMYSPSRQIWRDPNGKLYNAAGQPQ